MTRFVLREISYSYDPRTGAASESWTLEPETFGTPGETILIPGQMDDGTYVGKRQHRPIKHQQYDPRVRPLTPQAMRRAYWADSVSVWRTKNIMTTASPDWVIGWQVYDGPNYVAREYITKMVLDPHNPNALYVSVENIDYTDRGHIYYITGLDLPAGYWVANNVWEVPQSTLDFAFAVSPSIPGAVWIAYEGADSGYLYVYRRSGYGQSFVGSTVKTDISFSGARAVIAAGTSSSFSSTPVHVAYSQEDGLSGRVSWLVSTNGGVSFSEDILLPTSGRFGFELAIPVDNNSARDFAFLYSQSIAANDLLRRNDDSTFSDLTAGLWNAIGSEAYATATGMMVVSPVDRDCIYTFGNGGGGTRQLKRTINGGASWSVLALPDSTSSTTESLHSLYGWPTDKKFLALVVETGAMKGVWYTLDAYNTTTPVWVEITGDLNVITNNGCNLALVPYATNSGPQVLVSAGGGGGGGPS